MMPIRAVFQKEVMDNVRDRRVLLTALLMGPLFGPILFAFVINMTVKQSMSDASQMVHVPVIGQEHAPNLVRFMNSKNLGVVEGPEDLEAAMQAVKDGVHDVVVVIPPEFGEQLADGVPAMVEVVSDHANNEGERESRRVERALREYSGQIASLRLAARGVSPSVMRPLNIDIVDVSTPSGRSAMLLGMLSYFFIFALLSGGMNLAIDATAGERERGSMEPLLCLPVKRDQLIYGKVMATCLFMLISLSLSLAAFLVVLNFLPLKDLGMTPNFGPLQALIAFVLLSPFALLGAALMTLVASFTKSFKEAQSWVSVVLLAPTLPILIVSILMVRSSLELMFVPSLSQHLLLVSLIKNESLRWLDIGVSMSSTLVLGVLLTMLCARLYRREGLLG
jgi:sodium transport system permease protein